MSRSAQMQQPSERHILYIHSTTAAATSLTMHEPICICIYLGLQQLDAQRQYWVLIKTWSCQCRMKIDFLANYICSSVSFQLLFHYLASFIDQLQERRKEGEEKLDSILLIIEPQTRLIVNEFIQPRLWFHIIYLQCLSYVFFLELRFR